MPTEKELQAALDQYEQQLGKLKNVVGLGIARKAAAAQGKKAPLAVTVYVSKKVPKSALPVSELVPEFLPIESKGKTVKVPTQVIEQGEVHLESAGQEMPGKESL